LVSQILAKKVRLVNIGNIPCIFTHAESSRRGIGIYRRLSVCLFVYLHDILKVDAARIIKFDIQMFYDKSWKHPTPN